MRDACSLLFSGKFETMELAESVITQFKLHLQIHGSKITHRQLAVIVQRDKFSYIHTSSIILVKCAQIQFLFSVDFGANVYFQPSIHRSQNLVDFLHLSMPFCAFGAKRHGTGKMQFIQTGPELA